MCHLLALEWIQNGIVVGEEEVEVDLTVSETLKAGLSTVVSTGDVEEENEDEESVGCCYLPLASYPIDGVTLHEISSGNGIILRHLICSRHGCPWSADHVFPQNISRSTEE